MGERFNERAMPRPFPDEPETDTETFLYCHECKKVVKECKKER